MVEASRCRKFALVCVPSQERNKNNNGGVGESEDLPPLIGDEENL